MKINWLVRIHNKSFWLAMIPAIFLLTQSVGGVLGYQLDLTGWQEKAVTIVEAVFSVLVVLGVVVDPTTKGTGDSARALTYTEPYSDEDLVE